MAKKMPPEAQDVTEPLPGMDDPITRAKKDKKAEPQEGKLMMRKEMRTMPMPKKPNPMGMKKGGSVSASRRADGCAQRGKTKGRMV